MAEGSRELQMWLGAKLTADAIHEPPERRLCGVSALSRAVEGRPARGDAYLAAPCTDETPPPQLGRVIFARACKTLASSHFLLSRCASSKRTATVRDW